MDNSTFDIFKTLVKRSIKGERFYATLGVVKSVGATTYTITPNDGTGDIEVNILTDSTISIVPEVGSIALVAWTNKSDAYTLMTSGAADVVINGGNNGGLLKGSELINQLNIVTDRVDKLYDAIKNGVPAPTDGGTAYKATMITILNTQTEKEDYTGVINDKVKH